VQVGGEASNYRGSAPGRGGGGPGRSSAGKPNVREPIKDGGRLSLDTSLCLLSSRALADISPTFSSLSSDEKSMMVSR